MENNILSLDDKHSDCSECISIALQEGKPVFTHPSCANCTENLDCSMNHTTDTCESAVYASSDSSLEIIDEASEYMEEDMLNVKDSDHVTVTTYEEELLKQEKDYTSQIYQLENSLQGIDEEEKRAIEKLDRVLNDRVKLLVLHYDKLKDTVKSTFRARELQLKKMTANMKSYLFKIQSKLADFKQFSDKSVSNDPTEGEYNEQVPVLEKKHESLQTVEVVIPHLDITIDAGTAVDFDDSVIITAPPVTLVTRNPSVCISQRF